MPEETEYDILMLQRSWQACITACDNYTRRGGISSATLQIIALLYRESDVTQKAMCETTHLPKQTVNKVVSTLYKQRMIEMHELPEDRRAKAVRLTPMGRRQARRIVGNLTELQNNALGSFTTEQRADFIKMLQAVAAAVEAAEPPSAPLS